MMISIASRRLWSLVSCRSVIDDERVSALQDVRDLVDDLVRRWGDRPGLAHLWGLPDESITFYGDRYLDVVCEQTEGDVVEQFVRNDESGERLHVLELRG